MVEELAFDLRQKYAEIVGVHLERVTTARINKNYPDYFNALEDLYTVVRHKFKSKVEDKILDPEEKQKKKVKKKSDIEVYTELRKEAIGKANQYESVYLGNTEDPKEVQELEASFRAVEMFLFKVMDASKMFGSSGYNEGM